MNISFGAFGVFNTALTESQVTDLYNMHKSVYKPMDGYEWVLVNRDVASSPKTGDIQNVNVDSADDFSASYSILGDLKDGTNDMTDENLKINGKYKFRLIPYLSSDTQLAADNTTRYVEWCQRIESYKGLIITGFSDADFPVNHSG